MTEQKNWAALETKPLPDVWQMSVWARRDAKTMLRRLDALAKHFIHTIYPEDCAE